MSRKTIAQFEALLVTGYVMSKQDFADLVESMHPGYKVYTATLTQSGVLAPAASEKKNQLGTITPAYDSIGNYHLTGTGLFTGNVVIMPLSGNGFITATLTDVNTVSIATLNTSAVAANGILTNSVIEIRIYD